MMLGGDLQKAIDTNDAQKVQAAIDKGGDVTKQAVSHAATANKVEALAVLLEHAEEVGSSAMILAAQNGCLEALRVLLDAGTDPNLTGPGGTSALFYAALEDRGEYVDVLLEAGAEVDLTDDQERTALDIAIKHGSNLAARALVDAGAKVGDEQAAQLAKMGLEVGATPAPPDQRRRDEVLGRWVLSTVRYEGDFEAAGMDPEGPHTMSAKELYIDDNFVDFGEDGELVGRYWYSDFSGSWSVDGDRVTQVRRNRGALVYKLSEDGSHLVREDYDEEHGLDMYVTYTCE